jgi:hypothetical protein
LVLEGCFNVVHSWCAGVYLWGRWTTLTSGGDFMKPQETSGVYLGCKKMWDKQKSGEIVPGLFSLSLFKYIYIFI